MEPVPKFRRKRRNSSRKLEKLLPSSDPKKKTRYDSGQDLDEEGMNMGNFDANNIFKAFLGGPGGFSFEASGPGNFFFQFG
ncbi:DnaJ homolog subfamily C member 7 [Vulpes lagopus]